MRKGKGSIGVGTVLVGCVVANGASRVVAATSPPTSASLPLGQELADGKYSYYRVSVHNVSPDLMAWWIDPEHNAKPALIVESERVVAEYFPHSGQTGKHALERQPSTQTITQKYDAFATPYAQAQGTAQEKPARGIIALPDEVELMVPLPAQKALLVRATAVGMENLEKIVKYLDVPVRQVEIEAQFVIMRLDDEKALGIDEVSAPAPVATGLRQPAKPVLGFGFVHRGYQATLNDLVQQGKARIISSPRLVLDNNLTGNISSQTRLADVRVQIKSKTGQVVADSDASTGPNTSQFFLATTHKLAVTATINNDDTITLRLTPFVGSVLTNTEANGEIPVGGSQRINTTAISRNNDTIALGGLRVVGDEAATPERQLVIFVTPRIIRPVANQDTATQSQPVESKPVQP